MKITKQANKDKNKAKYELENFCEQYGLPPIALSKRKIKKFKEHKPYRMYKNNKFQPNKYYENSKKKSSKKQNIVKNLIITKKISPVINVVRNVITKTNVGQKKKLINYKYLKKIKIKSLKYLN